MPILLRHRQDGPFIDNVVQPSSSKSCFNRPTRCIILLSSFVFRPALAIIRVTAVVTDTTLPILGKSSPWGTNGVVRKPLMANSVAAEYPRAMP
jgi:hypothetical protein